MTLPDLAALAREASPEELPALLGKVTEIEAIIRLRLATVPTAGTTREADDNLSAEEAARRLGVSVSWLYKTRLPFKVRLGRRVLFSARGLERWNRQKIGLLDR